MLRGTGAVSSCTPVGPMMAHVHSSSDSSCFRGATEDNEGALTWYVDWLGIWRVFCDGGPRFRVSTIGMRLEAFGTDAVDRHAWRRIRAFTHWSSRTLPCGYIGSIYRISSGKKMDWFL
ncbi:hypothetical protein MRX96_031015 [Rhipicephalus microplus]